MKDKDVRRRAAARCSGERGNHEEEGILNAPAFTNQADSGDGKTSPVEHFHRSDGRGIRSHIALIWLWMPAKAGHHAPGTGPLGTLSPLACPAPLRAPRLVCRHRARFKRRAKVRAHWRKSEAQVRWRPMPTSQACSYDDAAPAHLSGNATRAAWWVPWRAGGPA